MNINWTDDDYAKARAESVSSFFQSKVRLGEGSFRPVEIGGVKYAVAIVHPDFQKMLKAENMSMEDWEEILNDD